MGNWTPVTHLRISLFSSHPLNVPKSFYGPGEQEYHKDRGTCLETARESGLRDSYRDSYSPSNGKGDPALSSVCHVLWSYLLPWLWLHCVSFFQPLCIFPPLSTCLSRCVYIFRLSLQLCFWVSAKLWEDHSIIVSLPPNFIKDQQVSNPAIETLESRTSPNTGKDIIDRGLSLPWDFPSYSQTSSLLQSAGWKHHVCSSLLLSTSFWSHSQPAGWLSEFIESYSFQVEGKKQAHHPKMTFCGGIGDLVLRGTVSWSVHLMAYFYLVENRWSDQNTEYKKHYVTWKQWFMRTDIISWSLAWPCSVYEWSLLLKYPSVLRPLQAYF